MAGQIPREFVTQLMESADIVSVIGEHVSLRKSGRNYSGLCPFHQEKTPSFSVSPEKQVYYCFGCQASGDILSFIREHRRLDFVEAVEYLASRMGQTVPREGGGAGDRRRTLKPLYVLLERAMRFYQQQLDAHPQREQAQNYLQKRGLSPETIGAFHLGFAPQAWDHLLRCLQAENPKQLRIAERIGLLRKRDAPKDDYYDYFRNRIIFPIRDTRGRAVGFGGRVLREEEHPKYLNSPETPLFHKRRLLYGLYETLQAESRPPRLLLVEGYLDVLTLHQAGMRYAVAALGTSPGKEHLELAFRYSSELFFCFDGDRAGRDAAKRQLENALAGIRDGRTICFLFLPDGEDPDSLVRKRGIEALERMLEQDSVPLSEFLFQHLQHDLDLELAEGRAALGARAKPYLECIPPSIFKTQLEQKLAEILFMERRELQHTLQQDAKGATGTLPGTAGSAPPPAPPLESYAAEDMEAASGWQEENDGTGPPARGYSMQQRLIGILLQRLEFAAKIADDCPLLDDSEDGRTLAMLCAYQRAHPSGSGAGLLGELEYLGARQEDRGEPLEQRLQLLEDWRQPARESALQDCQRKCPEKLASEENVQAILNRVQQRATQQKKRAEVSALIQETDAGSLPPEKGRRLREAFRGIREAKNPG